MENEHHLQNVDHSSIKVSQISLIFLNIIAFIINSYWLVVITTFLMLVGVLSKKPAFGFIDKYGLKPLNLVKAEILKDNPEPHQFAQLLGMIFMAIGSSFLLLGVPIVGWVFIWIVIALAALNSFGGFCVGCAIYYWFGRLNISGFTKEPPRGATPGRRPSG